MYSKFESAMLESGIMEEERTKAMEEQERKKAVKEEERKEQERNKAVKQALLLDPAFTRLLHFKTMEEQKASEEQRMRLMQDVMDLD